MSANPESMLAERLQSVVLPFTGRPLGAKNVSVSADQAAYRATVKLGFPLRHRVALPCRLPR
ncbi:MAG: hypothetical protein ACWGPN_03400, partial [Gammaproteobacteria bacterium]